MPSVFSYVMFVAGMVVSLPLTRNQFGNLNWCVGLPSTLNLYLCWIRYLYPFVQARSETRAAREGADSVCKWAFRVRAIERLSVQLRAAWEDEEEVFSAKIKGLTADVRAGVCSRGRFVSTRDSQCVARGRQGAACVRGRCEPAAARAHQGFDCAYLVHLEIHAC